MQQDDSDYLRGRWELGGSTDRGGEEKTAHEHGGAAHVGPVALASGRTSESAAVPPLASTVTISTPRPN